MSTAIGYSSEVLSSSAMMYGDFKELEVKLLIFLQANAASVLPTCLRCTCVASACVDRVRASSDSAGGGGRIVG